MKPLALAIGLFGAVTLPNICNAQIFDNPFAEYVERGVTINPSAGNANEANAAIQTIDPWPPGSADRSAPGNGPRVAAAIARYRTGKVYPPQGNGTSASYSQQPQQSQQSGQGGQGQGSGAVSTDAGVPAK